MSTIWKYPIPNPAPEFNIAMPWGAKVVRIALQDGLPTLWARVDPDRRLHRRRFLIRGTGHEVPNAALYVGTYETNDGEFVWHVFEDGQEEAKQ